MAMRDEIERLVTGLVSHLESRDSLADCYADEHWVAAEAVAYLRRKEGACGVAREVPYAFTEDGSIRGGYADVYACYDADPPAMRRHVFFEVKCIGAGARVPGQTRRDFVYDMATKLGGLDVRGTRDLWHSLWNKARPDAWLRGVGAETVAKIGDGKFVGIGLLLVGLHDQHGAMQAVRAWSQTVQPPAGFLPERTLRPAAQAAPVVCFACFTDRGSGGEVS